ncbi:post-transcriptional regulator [Vagococcus fluvialis]|jgi:ribulose bisphosphate carboxylase small subunit|uniref:ComN-like post-transcriptional regulator n=1 Tax=Vagococcus fluvialis TaxID=2738 RepID=A0A7X6D696_9ENTE|nr:post-transcriptional regulator [Vagococcus fluvialis]MBO0443522.1 hypothetical protein [Vagococcus fluvialis]NKC66586.1 hypothetical protein [Vagococcus fluvialis]
MSKKISMTTNWLLKGTIKEQVKSLLKSGYTEVTEKDMLDYLVNFRWKRKQPETIQKMKEDIKKITANDYFDYQQLKAVTKVGFDDLDHLL